MITEYIIQTLKSLKKDKPLLIAIDGVDTSGKTTLADQIFVLMKAQEVFDPIRIQIDKFHNPREIRKQKGDLSPEGFFYDSFNYQAIFQNVINPVRNGANKINKEIYDYRIDEGIIPVETPISKDTIILFDGIFMNRDELYQVWDLSIFLDIKFETVLERALQRDIELFRNEETIKLRFLKKYIPGEKLYLEKCNPINRADIVIDNNDFMNPKLIKKWGRS